MWRGCLRCEWGVDVEGFYWGVVRCRITGRTCIEPGCSGMVGMICDHCMNNRNGGRNGFKIRLLVRDISIVSA